MSAAMQPKSMELRLPATRQLPRRLSIELTGSRLYVYAFGPGKSWQSIASCNASLEQTTLHPKWPSLVLASAHFALTEAEAAEVERVFAPLGMKVDSSELRRD